jgi:hypothetical protein
LSVNEAKTVYSLLRDKTTKSKISKIVVKYEQRKREIHGQFRGIDHRTTKGEECYKAFAIAHSDFIIELGKVSKAHR